MDSNYTSALMAGFLEAVNAPNATHFGDPSSGCTVVGAACLGSFGQIQSAFGQRIVQLGVMLRF